MMDNTFSNSLKAEVEIYKSDDTINDAITSLINSNIFAEREIPSSGEIKKGVVIDVEATGLSIGHDDVIQLALLPFDYEVPSGKILKGDESKNSFL